LTGGELFKNTLNLSGGSKGSFQLFSRNINYSSGPLHSSKLSNSTQSDND